jgi:8-oxo-dGTP pyrophosphatase MutT (NUDIX family)
MPQRDNSHIIEGIENALKGTLPGTSAHLKMLPPYRKLEKITESDNVKLSGVLLLIFPVNNELNICFIRRPENMKFHGGQIAFPGGRHEKTDKNLVYTAIRESHEEIGILPEKIQILGELTPLYVSVSNFYIKPVVGWHSSKPDFIVNTHEVTELITLPIAVLASPKTTQIKNIETLLGMYNVPCYAVNNHIIWGATAMILSEFLSIYDHR